MQTPNINFCLTASAATTLIPNFEDPPPLSGGSETNSTTPLFSRSFAYFYRTRPNKLARARVLVRTPRLPRHEERARDIEQTTN